MLAALQILTVAQDPWRMRAVAVALGGATAFLGIGILVLAGFSQLPDDNSLGDSPIGYALRIGIGLALLLGSAWLLRPHLDLQKRMEVRVQHYVTDARIWIFFVVAFALSIKDVSSFAVLIPALHDIATSPANIVGRGLVFVLLYSLALLPVLGPILLRLVFGHLSQVNQERYQSWPRLVRPSPPSLMRPAALMASYSPPPAAPRFGTPGSARTCLIPP